MHIQGTWRTWDPKKKKKKERRNRQQQGGGSSGNKLGHDGEVIIRTHTSSSIPENHPFSYLLRMRWIHQLDFLCSFGPSLGYLWITITLSYASHLFLVLYTPPNISRFSHALFHLICLLSQFLSLFLPFSPLSLILSFVHFYSGKMHSISMHNHHQLPCLHCHPHSYIRTVSEISLFLSQSQTHKHTHGWSLVAESLVFFILEFMKTLYCLHGYTGSASDREVLAPSHEQRPMHKGTSWACQNMAPCHTYWSSLSSSPSLSLCVCVCVCVLGHVYLCFPWILYLKLQLGCTDSCVDSLV